MTDLPVDNVVLQSQHEAPTLWLSAIDYMMSPTSPHSAHCANKRAQVARRLRSRCMNAAELRQVVMGKEGGLQFPAARDTIS